MIELLIAIVIGMFLVIGAMSVLAGFEEHKRTTTALNDALQSGNFGMYQLDKLIHSAGTGFKHLADPPAASGLTGSGYGCALNVQPSNGATVIADNTTISIPGTEFTNVFAAAGVTNLRLAPAIIFPGGAASTTGDTLLLMLGGGGYGEAAIPIVQPTSGSNISVENAVGFSPGEWVLLWESSLNRCMITTIDNTYAPAGGTNVVLPMAQTTVGNGSLVNYSPTANSAATLLIVGLGTGTAAQFVMYKVGSNNTLYMMDLLNNYGVDTSVGDDVVYLRAVYGISSTGPTGPIDTWVNPVDVAGNPALAFSPSSLVGAAPNSANIEKIQAIRVAIVVRAPLNERLNNPNDPAPSTAINKGTYTLFGSLPNTYGVQYTWNAPASTYRYRVLEATIPLRDARQF